MMRLLLSTLIVGYSALSANAADMRYPVNEEEITTPVEFGSGWYIRGDIGLNFNGHMKDGTETSGGGVRHEFDINDGLDFSLGFGFRLNDSFRLESTLETTLSGDYTKTHSIDSSNCPTMQLLNPDAPRSPGEAPGCLETESAEYNSTVLMVNGYYDLPKMGNFEPYVGAGIGVARVSWIQEVGARTCVPTATSVFPEACVVSGLQQPQDGEIVTFGGTQSSGVDYQVAYSASAGMGYRIGKNAVIDANYRFMGTGSSGIDYNTSGSSHLGSEGFGVHQVRMGLRYELN